MKICLGQNKFSKPTFFEPHKDELDSETGKNLKLGPVVVYPSSISYQIKVPGHTGSESLFLIDWPIEIFLIPNLEILDRSGTVIWDKKLTKKDISAWRAQREAFTR